MLYIDYILIYNHNLYRYAKYKKYIHKDKDIYYLYPNQEFRNRFSQYLENDFYIGRKSINLPIAKKYFTLNDDNEKGRAFQWRHIPKFFKEISEIRSNKINEILH